MLSKLGVLVSALALVQASIIPAPLVATKYHSQDELGQYSYSYNDGPSAKSEVKTADGITRGSYSYIDSYGILQSTNYIADAGGFRVAATNLPVGPAAGHVVVPHSVISHSPVLSGSPVIASAPVISNAPVVTSSVISTVPAIYAPIIPAIPAPVVVSDDKPIEDSVKIESDDKPIDTSDTVEVKAAKIESAPVELPFPPESVKDVPEVIAARAQHLAEVENTKARLAAAAHFKKFVVEEKFALPAPAIIPTARFISTPIITNPIATAPILAAPSPIFHSAIISAASEPVPAIVKAPVDAKTVVAAASTPVATVVPAPSAFIAAPAVSGIFGGVSSQYHAQDELGQYAYGYAGGPSAKDEVKTFDGITRGGYSYVDAHGLVQSAAYVSDSVNGFRVAATNLPVQPAPTYLADAPDVAAAKVALFKAQAEHIAKL